MPNTRACPTYYCEVYMPIDRLAREPWELGIDWQALRVTYRRKLDAISIARTARLSGYPRSSRGISSIRLFFKD